MFGVLRVYALEGGVKQAKFFFFFWAGEKAPLKVKVAANAIKTQVLNYFHGLSGNVQISHHSELTEEEVVKRLEASRGSHKPSGYEFGVGSSGDGSLEDDEIEALRVAAEAEAARQAEVARLEALAAAAAAEEAARLAAIEAELQAERDRAAAAEAEKEAARQKKIASLPTHMRREIKRLMENPDIQGYDFSALVNGYVLEELADVDSPTAWIVCGVTEESPKAVSILARGSGGPVEVHPHLADDATVYGALRVTAVDRKGTRVSLRSRMVYFTWNGAVVDARTRFRNTGVIRAMAAYFLSPSLELKLNHDKSQLTEAAIQAALAGMPGAATEYKFGVYDKEVQADDYQQQLARVKAELAAGGVAEVDEAAKAAAEADERDRRARASAQAGGSAAKPTSSAAAPLCFIPKIGSPVVAVVPSTAPAKKWGAVGGPKPASSPAQGKAEAAAAEAAAEAEAAAAAAAAAAAEAAAAEAAAKERAEQEAAAAAAAEAAEAAAEAEERKAAAARKAKAEEEEEAAEEAAAAAAKKEKEAAAAAAAAAEAEAAAAAAAAAAKPAAKEEPDTPPPEKASAGGSAAAAASSTAAAAAAPAKKPVVVDSDSDSDSDAPPPKKAAPPPKAPPVSVPQATGHCPPASTHTHTHTHSHTHAPPSPSSFLSPSPPLQKKPVVSDSDSD